MFCPLSYRDALLIGRGLLILIVAITVGISVTEQQINSLTHWQECINVFDIDRDRTGAYSLAVFGHSYRLNAVVSLAEIDNGDKTIDIKTSIYTLHIPKAVQVDCRKELVWLGLKIRWLEQSILEVWQKIKEDLMQMEF